MTSIGVLTNDADEPDFDEFGMGFCAKSVDAANNHTTPCEAGVAEYAPKPTWLPIAELGRFEREGAEVVMRDDSDRRVLRWSSGDGGWVLGPRRIGGPLHDCNRVRSTNDIVRTFQEASIFQLPEVE